MTPSRAELTAGARFFRGLPGFLRHPVPPVVARRVLAERLAGRDDACLGLLRRIVSMPAEHPYRRLLRHAGCEYADVERLVVREGADGALRTLAAAGVYLTLDEFKGREAIERGTLRFTMTPAELRNRDILAYVPARTSGRRGTATPVVVDERYFDMLSNMNPKPQSSLVCSCSTSRSSALRRSWLTRSSRRCGASRSAASRCFWSSRTSIVRWTS